MELLSAWSVDATSAAAIWTSLLLSAGPGRSFPHSPSSSSSSKSIASCSSSTWMIDCRSRVYASQTKVGVIGVGLDIVDCSKILRVCQRTNVCSYAFKVLHIPSQAYRQGWHLNFYIYQTVKFTQQSAHKIIKSRHIPACSNLCKSISLCTRLWDGAAGVIVNHNGTFN